MSVGDAGGDADLALVPCRFLSCVRCQVERHAWTERRVQVTRKCMLFFLDRDYLDRQGFAAH